MQLINLTDHDIIVLREDRTELLRLEKCCDPARVDEDHLLDGSIRVSNNGWPIDLPLTRVYHRRVTNLPPPQKGTMYIVSRMVAEATYREDTLVPDMLVRDSDGRVLGCRAFSVR